MSTKRYWLTNVQQEFGGCCDTSRFVDSMHILSLFYTKSRFALCKSKLDDEPQGRGKYEVLKKCF